MRRRVARGVPSHAASHRIVGESITRTKGRGERDDWHKQGGDAEEGGGSVVIRAGSDREKETAGRDGAAPRRAAPRRASDGFRVHAYG